jgi:hypothetical protein
MLSLLPNVAYRGLSRVIHPEGSPSAGTGLPALLPPPLFVVFMTAVYYAARNAISFICARGKGKPDQCAM